MRKLLFLDVDGVLNSLKLFEEGQWHPLGEGHLQFLKTIVDQVDCDIVLSSTWRCYNDSKNALRIAFNRHGIKHWIGQTPDRCGERWTEIKEWLEQNVIEPCLVVVVDDDDDARLPDMPNVTSKFVQTSFSTGLDKESFALIIEGFNLRN